MGDKLVEKGTDSCFSHSRKLIKSNLVENVGQGGFIQVSALGRGKTFSEQLVCFYLMDGKNHVSIYAFPLQCVLGNLTKFVFKVANLLTLSLA
jgi:hypothetical protein